MFQTVKCGIEHDRRTAEGTLLTKAMTSLDGINEPVLGLWLESENFIQRIKEEGS